MPCLFGIQLRHGDVRMLVATLLAAGSPAAIDAALEINRGLERRAQLISLTAAERDAILTALDNPPEGLWELQGALWHDYLRRVERGE